MLLLNVAAIFVWNVESLEAYEKFVFVN